MIAVAGMDAKFWILCKDPLLRGVMLQIAKRRTEIAEDEREDLAGRIINKLSKSIKTS